jgi:hypothetical protein
MKLWQFLPRRFVSIVIAPIVAVSLCGAMLTWIVVTGQSKQREERIAQMIEEFGGRAIRYRVPLRDWIPQSLRFSSRQRVLVVDLSDHDVHHDLLRGIGSLTNLERLWLDSSSVNDTGLRHLTGLKNLKHLRLNETPVTDAGLVYLKSLTSLNLLSLDGTQTTIAGRAMLRKALPNCEIEPDP